jgi:hypothetical protein
MPTTTTGLPFPAATDTPDVPRDIQALAVALEKHSSAIRVQNSAGVAAPALGAVTVIPFQAASGAFQGGHPLPVWNVNGVVAPFDGVYQVNAVIDCNITGVSRGAFRLTVGGAAPPNGGILLPLQAGNTNQVQVTGLLSVVAGQVIGLLFSTFGVTFNVTGAYMTVVGPIL